MEYLPFGESLVEEHLNSNNSPFRFNAKELDQETGNYYYGARYGVYPEHSRRDPKFSIWISVDPLAEQMPEWSSYAYTLNNPVNFTDPTGMVPEESGNCGCPIPPCSDDSDIPKPVQDIMNRIFSWITPSSNKKPDDPKPKKDTPDLKANFTFWSAYGVGDHAASSGINNEKGEKHSIEVDAVKSWLKMAEYAGKGLRKIFGLDEEVDGYEGHDETSVRDYSGLKPIKMTLYLSTGRGKPNHKQIIGYDTQEEAFRAADSIDKNRKPLSERTMGFTRGSSFIYYVYPDSLG